MQSTAAVSQNIIETGFQSLLRGKPGELTAYIEEINLSFSLDDTKAFAHCYSIKLNGNGKVRLNDFIQYIAHRIIDYTIPRSKVIEADKYYSETGSTAQFSKLEAQAKNLFTDLKNTGEGGELLLYILTQEFLKIPQLLCKMPLKTNSRMHYHGVDGIHAEYLSETDTLALYWGESKIYKKIDSAIKSCFESLKPYLLSEGGLTSAIERDVQLVSDNLDLVDDKLQEAVLRYFDKDDPCYNKVQYRGICLIGFDCEDYPRLPNQMTSEQLMQEIKKKVASWYNSVSKNLKDNSPLDTFMIHVFLLPFPSVEEFRAEFLKVLGFN